MSEMIINQLKEYATIIAEDLIVDKTGSEFTQDLQDAFTRAMDFSKLICPACCVKENQSIVLNTESKSNSTESYACEKCDFDEELTVES